VATTLLRQVTLPLLPTAPRQVTLPLLPLVPRQVTHPRLPTAPRQVTLPPPRKAIPQTTAITHLMIHGSLQGNTNLSQYSKGRNPHNSKAVFAIKAQKVLLKYENTLLMTLAQSPPVEPLRTEQFVYAFY
jgi:hypothetical protein